VWAEGPAENFTHELIGTPCRDILERRIDIVPRGVAARYPDDPMLAKLGSVTKRQTHKVA
jgi:hypothetical protein